MEKTRSSPVTQKVWGWRDVVVCLGACGWWASFCGKIIWHTMGILATPSGGLRAVDGDFSIMGCLGQAIDERKVEEQCLSSGRPAASFALLLGFLFIWWNPCLKIKIKGTGGRMTGLSEYYKLQMLGLTISAMALSILWDNTTSLLEQQTIKALHAVMAAFTFAVCLIAGYCYEESDGSSSSHSYPTALLGWTIDLGSYSRIILDLSLTTNQKRKTTRNTCNRNSM